MVGFCVGKPVAALVGAEVEISIGLVVGGLVGTEVGLPVGKLVIALVGTEVVISTGPNVGELVDTSTGGTVSGSNLPDKTVGLLVGSTGESVGTGRGGSVGVASGAEVGKVVVLGAEVLVSVATGAMDIDMLCRSMKMSKDNSEDSKDFFDFLPPFDRDPFFPLLLPLPFLPPLDPFSSRLPIFTSASSQKFFIVMSPIFGKLVSSTRNNERCRSVVRFIGVAATALEPRHHVHNKTFIVLLEFLLSVVS